MNLLTMILWMTTLGVGSLGPDGHEDVKVVLARCIETMSAQTPISYTYRYYGTGQFKKKEPLQQGRVVIQPASATTPGQFTMAWLRTENRELLVVDETVYRYDHAKKRVRHNPLYRLGIDNEDRRKLMPIESLAYFAQSKDPRRIDYAKGAYTIEITLSNRSFVRATITENGLLKKLAMTHPNWGGWTQASLVLEIHDLKMDAVSKLAKQPIPVGYEVLPYSGDFPAIGQPAPDWKISDHQKTTALADYRGKWVIMDFWATWCPPCIKAIPAMERLHQRYKGENVAFLGMTWKETGHAETILKGRGGSYPTLNGDSLAAAYNLGESGLPIIYIISPEGILVDFIRDPRGAEDILPKILRKHIKP